MDWTQIFVTLITTCGLVFASTGFWSWRSAKKSKNSEILQKIEGIGTKVDNLQAKVDDIEIQTHEIEKARKRDKAVTARVRLLRFNGELLKDMRHTKGEFDQALMDADEYEKYCKEEPTFQNGIATESIENIKRCYRKCEIDKDFLPEANPNH